MGVRRHAIGTSLAGSNGLLESNIKEFLYHCLLLSHIFKSNNTLERAVDGAPSQIPRLNFLTPSNPKSHPWSMTQARE